MHTNLRHAAAAAAGAVLVATGAIALTAPAAAAEPLTANATVRGVEDSELSGSVVYSETDLAPGESFTATLTLTNSHDESQLAQYGIGYIGENVADVLQLDGCDAPSGVNVECLVDASGDTIRADVAALPPGETEVTVNLSVRPDVAYGTYDYDHFLLSDVTGSSFRPSFELTIDEPVTESDIAVSLDAVSGPLLGSRIDYTMTVANQGPGDASSATVAVDLPTQVNSVAGLPAGCSYDETTDEVTCTTGAIANGDEVTGTFRASLGLLSIGALPATATRTASTPADPNPANDSASANCTVLTSLIITCS